MAKKYIPNLRTLEEALDRKGLWVNPVTGHTVKLTLSGFFSVQKDGHTRLYGTLRDAWLALSLACLFIVPYSPSWAQELPKDKVVDCIIGEAEGGYYGMLAVAHAIRNRGHLRGVYGCNSPRVRYRKYSGTTFVQAVQAWEDSRLGQDITKGADHWQSDADLEKKPSWLAACRKTLSAGGNHFFVCPSGK